MKFAQLKGLLKSFFKRFSKSVSLKMPKCDYKIERYRFAGHFNILNVYTVFFYNSKFSDGNIG